MRITPDARFARNPDILFKTLEDEAVLVDQDEAVVWRLNEPGSVIWHAIDGRRTAEDLVAAVVERFDVDEGTAKRDTLDFLSRLAGMDLLHALR